MQSAMQLLPPCCFDTETQKALNPDGTRKCSDEYLAGVNSSDCALGFAKYCTPDNTNQLCADFAKSAILIPNIGITAKQYMLTSKSQYCAQWPFNTAC